MSIALVISSSQSIGLNGGTTSGIDTTGADLIVVGASQYAGTASTPRTLTDSKGNTWNVLTYNKSGDNNALSVLFYAINAIVGSGHTFTYTGSTIATVLNVMAFSGSNISAPFDAENGTTSSGTSIAPGSCAVNNANEVVVANLCLSGTVTGLGVDSSFTGLISTAYANSVNDGGAMAYKITSAAENPSFSWTNSVTAAAVAASFKAATGGAAAIVARAVSVLQAVNRASTY